MTKAFSQRTGFRVFCFAVLAACAVWQMLFSYKEQIFFSAGYDKTLLPGTRNFRALTHHARQKFMLEADLNAALALLQQALAANPSYVPAWLSLAELNNDLVNKERASAILNYIDGLTEGLKRWRWDKALTAYQMGKMEMLPGELRYIVHELGGKERNAALQLAFTLWDDPERLLENLGHENLIHLLGYAVAKTLAKHALYFWHSIEVAGGQWQQKDALALLDMLLRAGEVQPAAAIWRKYFNLDKIFFNGDFSQPFLEKAFGWRTGKKNNFEQVFMNNPEGHPGRILHYRFKGWENSNFTCLSQIVPLVSGRRYILTAEMKSKMMTTNERPFLEVSGFNCKMPATNAEMAAPDQDWKRHMMVVNMPEGCDAAVVRLRRKESNHIDGKLAGQLWLRNFDIAEMGEDSPRPKLPNQ